MLYNSYLTNITGADRAEMMKVIDNDDAFDKWREEYDRKLSKGPEKAGTKVGGKRVSVSKEDFLKFRGEYKPPA